MRRLGLATLLSALWILCAQADVRAQLSPEDELKTFQHAKDLEISLFASEPMITNPSCIDVDSHGRVWVAEIQWYRKSSKQPPADKIKVLEDTDGDGRADRVTVFADGIMAPMSVCVCGDKVYAFIEGDLLVWEDKNGDLVADGPPRKLLTGFAKANHDHTSHSMIVGPDHKWYMSHGDEGFDVTGTDGSHIASKWGALVRGEMDGSQLEIVAHNFRNPYEPCISSFGESFLSDNDNDGNESVRICWMLEGGDYGWFGWPPFTKRDLPKRVPANTPFREAWHFRGHIPGYVPGTLVTGFGSPTGICFYEGDAFPQFKNAALHTDPGPRVLRVYRHTPEGAGMKATSEVWWSNEGDNHFRPDDVCVAPDGSLLVSDWYDGGVGGHAYTNPDQGRIFLVKPKGKLLPRADKPGPYASVADAIAGLKSPNLATRFLAREKLLAERGASIGPLAAMLDDAEPNNRARALWLLDRMGGEARHYVVDQLRSNDPALRALAVRILRRHGDLYADAMLSLADDDNAEVRREVILACGRINSDQSLAVLTRLASTYDGHDRYLLEALNIAAGDRREQLYQQLVSSGDVDVALLPLLQLLNPSACSELLAARLSRGELDQKEFNSLLAAIGANPSPEMGRGLLSLIRRDAAPPAVRQQAMSTLVSNLNGDWKTLLEDSATIDTFRALLKDNAMRHDALGAVRDFSLAALASDVAAIAVDAKASAADRQQAIGILASLNTADPPQVLRGLLSDKDKSVRLAALAAIVDLQDVKTLREILIGNNFSSELRSLAAARLLDSTGGAIVLSRMVDANELADDLRREVIAAVAAHPDANLRLLFDKHLDPSHRPKKLGAEIKPEEILALSGDAHRGEEIFQRSASMQCKNCHVVHEVGADIGPDLSLIGRKYDRAALLETILNPSKAISHEYKPYLVETTGGRVFVGLIVQRDDKLLVLKDIKGTLIRLPTSEIAELEEQERSLMPELVLQDVSAQDAADLLAYLTTLTESHRTAKRVRVLGPFDNTDLAAVLSPEENTAAVDLTAVHKRADGGLLHWNDVAATSRPYPSVDLTRQARSQRFPNGLATYYFLTFLDSAAAQDATFEIGSGGGVKAWLNGQMIHDHDVKRKWRHAEDQVSARIQSGRNVLLLKVVCPGAPGALSLRVRTLEPIELRAE